MGKFIVFTFLMLGVVFYEMSGGADFEPELQAPIEVASTELAPAEQPIFEPDVARADTASLIQIAAPVSEPEVTNETPLVAETVSYTGPLPAGQVIITPAPTPVAAEPVAEPVATEPEPLYDIRAVAGDWVNMRSGPSTDFRVLDTLPRGTEAEVLEVDADGWARIRLMGNGQEGWMAERLLTDG